MYEKAILAYFINGKRFALRFKTHRGQTSTYTIIWICDISQTIVLLFTMAVFIMINEVCLFIFLLFYFLMINTLKTSVHQKLSYPIVIQFRAWYEPMNTLSQFSLSKCAYCVVNFITLRKYWHQNCLQISLSF